MSCITDAPGWPADSGPLHTLHALGLIDDPARSPDWLHCPSTATIAGVEVYHAGTHYLNNISLVALAALTLEGWNVQIKKKNARLRIKVSPQ